MFQAETIGYLPPAQAGKGNPAPPAQPPSTRPPLRGTVGPGAATQGWLRSPPDRQFWEFAPVAETGGRGSGKALSVGTKPRLGVWSPREPTPSLSGGAGAAAPGQPKASQDAERDAGGKAPSAS